MKKLLYLLIALLFMASCDTEKIDLQYTVDVSLDTIVDGYAYLQIREDGEWVKLDSVTMNEGGFSMYGTIEYPSMHYIYIKGIKRNVPVFLDEGQISVSVLKDDYSGTIITGSPAHDEYASFQELSGKYDKEMREIYRLYKVAKDSGTLEEQDSLDKLMEDVYEAQQDFVKEYITKNNALTVSPYIAYKNSYSWTVNEIDNIVNNFDPALQGSPDYKLLADRIIVLKRVDIGQPLVDFIMKDTSGVDVRLSEVSKGKYMLVDFWASWCGPCRAENPNVVACYNDFHKKGFDVLGVSFDNNREKWIKAIHDDELFWHHVSDLQYWNNAAGKLYGIRSIPSSILLDAEGIIIAKNLRGKELREKLEELMP